MQQFIEGIIDESELTFYHELDEDFIEQEDRVNLNNEAFVPDDRPTTSIIADLIQNGFLPRSYFPLAVPGSTPYTWEFVHKADWTEDDFSQTYWDFVGFTYSCEKKQFEQFGMGTSEFVGMVCLNPYCEHTRIVPSAAVVASVSKHWKACVAEDLTFELFKGKHEASQQCVEFTAVFTGNLKARVPYISGKITGYTEKETGATIHRTIVTAPISYAYFERVSLASVFKEGLEHVLGILFTRTNELYRNSERAVSQSALLFLDILKEKRD